MKLVWLVWFYNVISILCLYLNVILCESISLFCLWPDKDKFLSHSRQRFLFNLELSLTCKIVLKANMKKNFDYRLWSCMKKLWYLPPQPSIFLKCMANKHGHWRRLCAVAHLFIQYGSHVFNAILLFSKWLQNEKKQTRALMTETHNNIFSLLSI